MEEPFPSMLIIFLNILGALALVLLNGLFVAAEFAFVKARPTRIAQLAAEGSRKAKTAQLCIENIDAYLSVCQLGITLSSLGLGWLGEPAVADLITPLLYKFGITVPTVVHSISFVIAFSVITFLHVVFGELAPKTVAIQKAESITMWLAAPMRFFYLIFRPAVALLNGTARKFLLLLGMKSASEKEMTHTEEELMMLISESYKVGHINQTEQELLQNVFQFERRVARDVMVPRPETVFLNRQHSFEKNLAIARKAGHTRYPLYDGSRDNVIGQIHIKDLVFMNGQDRDIESIKRDVLLVPEGTPLERLLQKFKKSRQQMAVVVDEYGSVAGIVTMENLLEELVGDIQDEFDQEEPEMITRKEDTYSLSGRILLDEAEKRFDLSLSEEDEEYSTLAGFVMNKLGRFPKEGDYVIVDDWKFEVAKMKGMRIDRIYLSPAPAQQPVGQE